MKKIFFILLCLTLVTTYGCRKAGKGGKAKISVHFYEKDNDPVFEGMIYVKYNATTFPGNDVSVYDDSRVTDYGAHAVFENLRQGEYYFYGVKDSVKGGVYYKIDNRIGEREVVVHDAETIVNGVKIGYEDKQEGS